MTYVGAAVSNCFSVSIKETSVAKLGSVCRRVYRIFSHAYFHHRALFDEYEVHHGNLTSSPIHIGAHMYFWF